MSKRRGLSVEEKRTRSMEFFYSKKDFYQLKELERQLPKEKGITSQSVKEIIQGLVDDAMVDTDKIGTCVYFWAFPSKASENRKRKMKELSQKVEECKKRKSATAETIRQTRVGREETSEREEILEQLVAKKDQKKHLEAEIEQYRECDPEVMTQMKEDAVTAKEAANRWTDNVFSIKSWVKNKFCFEESVIDKQFGIPDDFDYID